MNLKGKRCVVVGLGASGSTVIEFLKIQNAKIYVSESQKSEYFKEKIEILKKNHIEFEFGGHTEDFLQKGELIILSPGIPYDIPQLEKPKKNKIPIIGELELASLFIKCPILAVTGTNGKSTTASLLHKMILKDGKQSFLGGNIGEPLLNLVLSKKNVDYVVVEVSSFQLETTEKFHPKLATCLNVTADHLDRHPTFESYLELKKRIYLKMNDQDTLVLNADDQYTKDFAKDTKIKRLFFSRAKSIKDGCIISSKGLKFVGLIGNKEITFAKMKLIGAHNQENIAAASLMAKTLGLSITSMQTVVDDFEGLPHRMELVRELNGIKYYNDSKGTNIGSTAKSIESFDKPIILIAGGKDKGTDLSLINSLIKKRVQTIVLFGEAKNRMHQQWEKLTNNILVRSLEEAVEQASKAAKSGDIILFSPACSSFDQFKDYKHRGECFRSIVMDLKL